MQKMPQIPNIVIYLVMAFIIFMIFFLTVRFILQLIFIKECPNCGRNVSLAVGKTCQKCGYVFMKERYTRLNWTIAILATAVICIGTYDIKTFRAETDAYVAAHPYLMEKESVDSTEIPSTEGTTEATPAEAADYTE